MPDLAGKKLGVLLTTAPTHPNFQPAMALMRAALDRGVRLYLYCIDDGVRSAATPEVEALKARGASVFGCAYGAGRRDLALDESATWSGLTVLADVVGSTDRFVSF
jgi:sulfur relay (sulfurtransferase) complex TusBCD TusD component (DsrE family)